MAIDIIKRTFQCPDCEPLPAGAYWVQKSDINDTQPASTRAASIPDEGPVGGIVASLGIRWHLHQRCDQAQQCLLCRPFPAAQELAQLNVGQSTPSRGVGLVNDESMTAGRLAPEEPCIAVRAAIEFSSVGHGSLRWLAPTFSRDALTRGIKTIKQASCCQHRNTNVH
jgi:hypothetical protein